MFLEPQNGIFWVGCVYGRNDDAGRFAWFCGAAAEYIRTSESKCAPFHLETQYQELVRELCLVLRRRRRVHLDV